MYRRVYVEITNQCNANCSFCPGTVRPPRRMSIDEFKLIAERLQGVTQYLYYHLMGEPLTHPLLPEMLRHARSLGYKSVITTNGKLLPQLAQQLIDAGVYKVNISVHSFEDGTREQHIAYLDHCLDFADRASRAGTLVVFRLWNKGYDAGRNIDTVSLMRQRFPGEWVESAQGTKVRDRFYLEYGDRFKWPDMTADELETGVFCYGFRDHFGILCDGRVVPCCLDREGEITIGNIYRQPIEEILESPRVKAMVNGFSNRKPTEELCRRCGYAKRFG